MRYWVYLNDEVSQQAYSEEELQQIQGFGPDILICSEVSAVSSDPQWKPIKELLPHLIKPKAPNFAKFRPKPPMPVQPVAPQPVQNAQPSFPIPQNLPEGVTAVPVQQNTQMQPQFAPQMQPMQQVQQQVMPQMQPQIIPQAQPQPVQQAQAPQNDLNAQLLSTLEKLNAKISSLENKIEEQEKELIQTRENKEMDENQATIISDPVNENDDDVLEVPFDNDFDIPFDAPKTSEEIAKEAEAILSNSNPSEIEEYNTDDQKTELMSFGSDMQGILEDTIRKNFSTQPYKQEEKETEQGMIAEDLVSKTVLNLSAKKNNNQEEKAEEEEESEEEVTTEEAKEQNFTPKEEKVYDLNSLLNGEDQPESVTSETKEEQSNVAEEKSVKETPAETKEVTVEQGTEKAEENLEEVPAENIQETEQQPSQEIGKMTLTMPSIDEVASRHTEEKIEEAPAEPIIEELKEEKPVEPIVKEVKAENEEPILIQKPEIAEENIEETPTEPIVEEVQEEQPVEPIVEEVKAESEEPVVEEGSEVAEENIEETPAEPVTEEVQEEQPIEPVAEEEVKAESEEPVVEEEPETEEENIEETPAEPVTEEVQEEQPIEPVAEEEVKAESEEPVVEEEPETEEENIEETPTSDEVATQEEKTDEESHEISSEQTENNTESLTLSNPVIDDENKSDEIVFERPKEQEQSVPEEQAEDKEEKNIDDADQDISIDDMNKEISDMSRDLSNLETLLGDTQNSEEIKELKIADVEEEPEVEVEEIEDIPQQQNAGGSPVQETMIAMLPDDNFNSEEKPELALTMGVTISKDATTAAVLDEIAHEKSLEEKMPEDPEGNLFEEMESLQKDEGEKVEEPKAENTVTDNALQENNAPTENNVSDDNAAVSEDNSTESKIEVTNMPPMDVKTPDETMATDDFLKTFATNVEEVFLDQPTAIISDYVPPTENTEEKEAALENIKRVKPSDIKTIPLVPEVMGQEIWSQPYVESATANVGQKDKTKTILTTVLISIVAIVVISVIMIIGLATAALFNVVPEKYSPVHKIINSWQKSKAGISKTVDQVMEPEVMEQERVVIDEQPVTQQEEKQDTVTPEILEQVKGYLFQDGTTLEQRIKLSNPTTEGDFEWSVYPTEDENVYSVAVKLLANKEGQSFSYRFNYNVQNDILAPTTSEAKNIMENFKK